ncbi:MAG: multidrug efflux system outer membrane protein [Rhodothermales bacterium]|jgi:multidrug efflux system outer membrane protein
MLHVSVRPKYRILGGRVKGRDFEFSILKNAICHHLMPMIRNYTILLSLILLTGCVTTEPTPLPELGFTTPPTWRASANGDAPPSPAAWVDDFDDPMLSILIYEALERNHDLHASAARFRAAMALATRSAAAEKVQLNFGSSTSRAQRPNSRDGRPHSINTTLDNDFTVSWDADLWDSLATSTRAQLADAERLGYLEVGAHLAAAVTVARLYCDIVTNLQLIDLGDRTVNSFTQTLDVVDSRFQRGLEDAVDVHLARANVASARAQREASRAGVDRDKRGLEVVLGRYPAAEISVAERLPVVRAIPSGVPSDLLLRRPDLRAAERRQEAAALRAQVATRARLPSIRLTAAAGTVAQTLSRTLNPEHLAWSVAGNLAQPIFDGGRITADIARTAAEAHAESAAYAQAILTALREVETALARETYFGRQLEDLEIAAAESARAEERALELYQEGLSEITTVLVAQRRAVDAERALINTRNAHLQNRLDLYLGLGGSFSE